MRSPQFAVIVKGINKTMLKKLINRVVVRGAGGFLTSFAKIVNSASGIKASNTKNIPKSSVLLESVGIAFPKPNIEIPKTLKKIAIIICILIFSCNMK